MNEIEGRDVELDWLDGQDEPGELRWTEGGWSLADVPVASAAQRFGVVSGLDSQGCSRRQTKFDLERLFNIRKCDPAAAFA